MTPDTLGLLLCLIPAWLFPIIYLNELRHVRVTVESVHLIAFTLILALIITEQLARDVWPERITPEVHVTLVALLVVSASFFLWQRLYMLLRYQVLPRVRRQRAEAGENALHE